ISTARKLGRCGFLKRYASGGLFRYPVFREPDWLGLSDSVDVDVDLLVLVDISIKHVFLYGFLYLASRHWVKVKDIYDGGGYLVLVTTDRQSAFDRILASIPFKGQTSLWWFNRTQHITPDAVLSAPDKNVATAKKCSVFPIELVEEENVQATDLPLVNPYSTYQRPSFSPIKSIKSLINISCKNVREYVQSSKFDKYLIYGGQKEQFVTLDIPSNFPQDWIQHGYSHIHFGAIRLALNYHGTYGKPVVSRIALLDSKYKRYRDACIGTVEATLSSGMAMIKIVGAEMVESAITLTLHYQIVYRFQDHAFKLSNHNSEDSLLISVNTREEPHCVPVPKQIPKQELLKLFPEKWPFAISAYTTNLPNTVDDVTFSNWKSRI
ncbi:hypothetical protein Golob_005278, partial [Gossypium lobatum]|nr:hypothetical protein [Gossypium lobatum]